MRRLLIRVSVIVLLVCAAACSEVGGRHARDVYVLHDVHGYTHREIADLMGIVEGTSKSQLNRARSLLRSALP